jgi:LacI family transcriptional regulator
VDGVAVMTFGVDEMMFDGFNADGIPMVFIDAAPARPFSSSLPVDYRGGIHEAVQHLAVLGHRQMGFISGPLRLRSSQARKTAFLECLREIGVEAEPGWLIEGDHTLAGGRDAMERILAQTNWPTAIVCSNDMTAIGVQHALFEASLNVPADFSLIGFDDIHLAEYTIPPLTTVRMSCRDIAIKAVAALLAHLDGLAPGKDADSSIHTHLIVRRTTGLPRHALEDIRPSGAGKPPVARG